MKTVKEYANSVGKSHQSVYKQLNSKKNKERLESHVWKQDGTTYLDDVAIDILNESRQMIQIQNDIQAHEDNDNLRKEVDDLKNKIINLQDELKVKTEQMTSLLLENKEKTFLLEQKKDQTEEINRLKEQLDREKKEQLNQQVKQLKARKSQEERKARTKRLIEIGAAVESVLNRPIEHDELPKLIDFLKIQEQRGHFFSKAMNKDSQNYNSNNDEQD